MNGSYIVIVVRCNPGLLAVESQGYPDRLAGWLKEISNV